MHAFVYTALPSKVLFGFGTLDKVADEVRMLGCRRALVLSTPQQVAQAEDLAAKLGDLSVGTFTQATMHTPVAITEQALELCVSGKPTARSPSAAGPPRGSARRSRCELICRKSSSRRHMPALKRRRSWVKLRPGRKTTQRTLKVLPELIVYDVDLTLTLPTGLTVTSGMNAIAHAVEALYSPDANPLISLLAMEGIAALARALPAIVRAPTDRDARSDALYGAWACGVCLGSVGMALHHKLCHVLGGSLDLPHAETHTVVLPHAVAYNESAAAEALRPVARILGASTAADGLSDLARRLGAPVALKDLGMPPEGIRTRCRARRRQPLSQSAAPRA